MASPLRSAQSEESQPPKVPRLRRSLERAPVISRGGYPYFVHPLTDGVPPIEPDLLEEVVEALRGLLPKSFDLLVVPEAMGIHLGATLSLATRKPVAVVRKRAYGLPGEMAVEQTTGYGHATLHLNGIRKDHRVVIVDDVVSTGGTLRAVAEGLKRIGAKLVGALVVINKDADLEALGREIGSPITALVRVRVLKDRLEVVPARG